MRIAALTFVYNEHFNLPIWTKYYGACCGEENLFVVDRGSTDGCVDNLGQVNVIRVPRKEFDEDEKTNFMNHLHASLLSFYDCVILTDCDEIILPSPSLFPSLRQYIELLEVPYINCVGLDLVHIIDREPGLRTDLPLLAQRRYALFHRALCKQAIAKVRTKWLPGFHCSTNPPNFDPNLFLIHLKFADLYTAINRQLVNIATVWSDKSLEANYGAHHRFDLPTFVHGGFLAPCHEIRMNGVADFEFQQEIGDILGEITVDANGYHRWPFVQTKRRLVMLPDTFSKAF